MKRIELAQGVTRIAFEAADGELGSPVAFCADGEEFLRQASCEFSPREVWRIDEVGDGEVRQTANGEVTVFSDDQRRLLRQSRSARLRFEYPGRKLLTGLGQHERGVYDYSREVERLYHHNMKIPIPFLLSSAGWGLLIEAGCAMRFSGAEGEFTFELDAVEKFSYVVIRGSDCADVLRKLAELVGRPAMLPKWAFGYIQSKERYKSAAELMAVSREFRRRGLGLDCIVLDWMSWRAGCWGDKEPDPERFPDVRALTEALHALSVRLMVSVWPNVGKGRDHDEFAAAGMFLPGSKIYDAFRAGARELYWKQCRRHWLDGGADALWCDSCEPITDPDWCGAEKRGEEERRRLITGAAELRMEPEEINDYAAYHLRGLRAHWLRDIPAKRPVVLSRSGGIDSSALGAILWSGDVCARWEVLRNQVTEGIRTSLSGISYWTLDIGAFFVAQREQWFWRGDYPRGVEDPAYRELYVRWFQFGAMLPVFRSHGTDTPREPWAFGGENSPEYRSIRAAIALRYRLLPYIYAVAAQSCREGLPMLRAMLLAFGDKPELRAAHDCYMFGPALLIKPVTRPLAEGGGEVNVSLPRGGWYDLFTLQYFEGGGDARVDAPLDRFPLFARAGSILPVAEGAVCADGLPLLAREIWVFGGADGEFCLYDDAGDGMDYLRGAHLTVPARYDEAARELTLGRAEGGLPADCALQIRFLRPDGAQYVQTASYTGAELRVRCPETPAQPQSFLASEAGVKRPWRVTFLPEDGLNERLKKAAHVCPSPAQMKWMERAYIGFLHFSPNTFTGRQWGEGSERPEDFAPDALDPAQWARVCRQAGMRMLIPTLKHHDGFCQWRTQTTRFSVESAPATGDVAAALRDACAREGIALGVYLSPWDMHQRNLGVWGTEKYEGVFLRQLTELLSGYGEIGELWLDGACGDRPVWEAVESYRPEVWYDRMEKLQPDCVVRKYDPFAFADEDAWENLKRGSGELNWRGKEVRWVGNEDGSGRADEWSVQPVFSRTMGREATLEDLGSERYYADAVGAVWYPNEVNTHLLNQWFWNEQTSRVRPLRELVDVFYNSIGNNGTLLLNVSPDRHGRIPDDQARRLMEFRSFMEDTFSVNLAADAQILASSAAREAPAEAALRGDEAHWSPGESDWDIDVSTASFELRLPAPRRFDNLCLREDVRQGQRVARWRASVWIDGAWRTIAERRTIGFRRIVRFPAVTADRVRVEILRSWDVPRLRFVGLYLSRLPETEEEIAETVEIPPLEAAPQSLRPGAHYRLFAGGMQSAARVGLDGRAPVREGVADVISEEIVPERQDFSLCFDAYFYQPFRREAQFALGSADGCILTLNGQRVIDLDEPHDYAERQARVRLREGYYHLRLQYTSFRNPRRFHAYWTDDKNNLCPLREGLLHEGGSSPIASRFLTGLR